MRDAGVALPGGPLRKYFSHGARLASENSDASGIFASLPFISIET